MTERILVASDGSSHSDGAFAVALQLAKALDASLTIVTVIPYRTAYDFSLYASPSVGLVAPLPASGPDEVEVSYYREVAERLGARARSHGVRLHAVRYPEGEPSVSILDVAETEKADLIVVGARGRSVSRSLLLGSVSFAVVHGAKAATLVVRGGPAGAKSEPRVEKVVIAVDGSAASDRALENGLEIGRGLGVAVRIVTCVPPPDVLGLGSTGSREREAAATRQAGELLERSRAVAVKRRVSDVSVEVLHGSPVDSVLDYLGNAPTTLLVVGSRGRSPAQSLILGSVSSALLHHVVSMVLIVKALSAGRPAHGTPGR